jgi:thiol:disulfide interchange protein DsbD
MHNGRRLTHLFFGFLILLLPAWLAWAEDDLLLPDQAYPVSAETDGPQTVVVTWDIQDGYYLYKNKIRFRSETEGVTAGEPEFPPAKVKHDEFFGDVEIYRGSQGIRVPLTRDSDTQELVLEAQSQGCADRGICYPPHRQILKVALPAIAAAAAPSTPTEQPASALAALGDLGRNLGFADEDELLEPDQAFRFDAQVEAADRLRLTWVIAEGTYLYKDKVEIALEGGDGVALGAYRLPPPKVKKDTIRPDGEIGDVEVYVHDIDLTVPLTRSLADATETTLVVKYQGCAERGVCYPPITRKLPLSLPAADRVGTGPAPVPAIAPVPTVPEESARSETDQIAHTLGEGNTWAVIVTFFGFGLLLAFTPCVFPMIPILSGIIAGQGKNITTRKAFTLSLVYVLAMALTYTVAGVLAGLFGENIQALFQDPWILGFFALVFVLLALSMFGFYELQLPSSLQSRLTEMSNRQEGGSIAGVAIMGLLSALIVGPCVAPPLAGALIFIGQTGDWALGGLALFALSMGMGAPLIAIGTSAGKLLPRAGAWMDAVKGVFGVALLAVAIIMLERIVPAEIALMLWGALLICSAVYMGALRDLPVETSGWAKLWKGLGVVLLVYGVLMLVGAAAGGKDTVQPLRGLAVGGAGGTSEPHTAFKRIKTLADLEREVAGASAAGKPVMLDFYADWCVSCKEMERYTFSDARVIAALADFVLLQADVTANDEQDKALLQGHFGLPGPPAIMFYGRDGREKRHLRVVGFKPAEEFAAHVGEATR